MRIILSRKGFDAKAGGVPSPIFPDGTMVSLPIPTSRSKVGFADIRYKDGWLGDIVNDLTGDPQAERCNAHLDPDLRASALDRSPGWRPLFGQISAAQTHLSNQRVDIGDLFLFFGWFRAVERSQHVWRYVHFAEDQHVLWGWLQIGQIIRKPTQTNAPAWASYHPHFHIDYSPNNTVYVASEELRLDEQRTGLPGGGEFQHYDAGLRLTAPGSKKRSIWHLPLCFYPKDITKALSYHQSPKFWDRRGNNVLLHTVGRGQEFVLDTSDCPGVVTWARDLIRRHATR
jgi:hypothetical protein